VGCPAPWVVVRPATPGVPADPAGRRPRGLAGLMAPGCPVTVGVTCTVRLPVADDTPWTAVLKPPSRVMARTAATPTATATAAAAGPAHSDRALGRRCGGAGAAASSSGNPNWLKSTTLAATNIR